MKDYKLLLAGLILLLLILFIAVFTWLWIHNRKNIDPLPVMANKKEPIVVPEEEENAVSNSTLYIQAEENLQTALEDVVVSFESRYPHVQVRASYVPAHTLLTLSNATSSDDERSEFMVGVDMIIANDSLPTERLAPLQAELQAAQNNKEEAISKTDTAKIDDTNSRSLNSYNYALRDEKTLEGVILTDNTAAVNFRNFLLSSTGQDILKKYDYHNIEGYKNSVDDLFNPTSRAKQASSDTSVDVADALSNGKS
jgi:ABC-type molybdate transport system substrate-binding protein